MAPETDAKNQKKGNLVARPPVVVVMGHVDHGKTKLLYSRNNNLTERMFRLTIDMLGS